MKIRTESGIAESMPLSDIQENNRWLKVLAISFALFVVLLIAFALWLKFSGIGHNIIYELSPKESGNINILKENIDFWADMWKECEFGEKDYKIIGINHNIHWE